MSSYRQALKVARTEHIRKLVDNNQNNPRFLFSTVARLTNLRHPRRTLWVPNGTGQRCVGRYCIPEPHSLGCWQKWVVGKSEEAERRTLSSHGPEKPGGKGNCSFFEKVGTAGPSSTSWTIWGLAGTRGCCSGGRPRRRAD